MANYKKQELTDFVRIFQDEYDHLDGIVFLDRLETTQDIITEQEYQKRVSVDKYSSKLDFVVALAALGHKSWILTL